MNTGELVRLVYEKVGDPEGIRYGISSVINRLNEAQTVFVQLTKCLRGEAQLAASPRTPFGAFYTLPDDAYAIERLEYRGRSMIATSESQMRARFADYRVEQGEPDYVLFGRWSSKVDTPNGPTVQQECRLVPNPGFDCQPYCEYLHTPLPLEESNMPEVPQLYHFALAHYAAASLLQDDDDNRDPTKVQLYRQEFERNVDLARSVTTQKGMASPRRLVRRIP